MKRLMLVVLLATAAVAVTAPLALASSHEGTAQYQELLRSDLRAEKTAVMTVAMPLTTEQADVFWPIWREYQFDFETTGDAMIALLKDYADNLDNMDDKKAEDLAKRSFDIQKKRLDLRKKYWKKINKQLGGVLAARFMQVDGQLTNLINLQIGSLIPFIEKTAVETGEH
jgi:hypothetical protein